MKVLFGNGVAEMRGSQAGVTASRNRGGSYFRQRVTPLNPNSVRQQSVRGNMTELTTAWSNDLTEAQRTAWIAFANSWPITDVFGASIILTGLQYYVRTNTVLMQGGIARMDDAPANLDVQQLLTVTAAGTVSAQSLDCTFTPTPTAASMRVQVFATPAISPGISFVKNKLRLIATSGAAQGSPINVGSSWIDAFGSYPTAGAKIVVSLRIMNEDNGVVCTPLEASVIVSP